MAAPGGGRLWSQAWKWFNEKQAYEEGVDLRKNVGHLPAVAKPVQEIYRGLPEVSGSVICFGCTGYVGEAVVFDAVRRGLKVTVFIREKSVQRFTAILDELKITDRVVLAVGDATVDGDVEKAMKDSGAQCCISLLASSQITNEQSIYDIDYAASHRVVQMCRKCGIEQFIHCSDTGCYQPALACQMHKLRIEGELMRATRDGLQYTIVRPTTYHPYVVSVVQLDEVRRGKNVQLFGSHDNAGDLAVYNPISREDTGRFIVSCVLNECIYGRTLAIGGPWSADNVSSLKDTTNWMIQYGSPPNTKPSKITPLGMNLSEIIYRFMETFGTFSKQLKKVATIVFYYTKYWSSVHHFSPGTGVYGVKEYTKELCAAANKDPEGFAKFVENAKTSATTAIVFPTPRNSWWDLTEKSLSPDQMPMGAGKPKAQFSEADTSGLMHLRTMVPVRLGELPLSDGDSDVPESEMDSDWIKTDGMESEGR